MGNCLWGDARLFPRPLLEDGEGGHRSSFLRQQKAAQESWRRHPHKGRAERNGRGGHRAAPKPEKLGRAEASVNWDTHFYYLCFMP